MSTPLNAEQRFWLLIVALICATICAITASIAGYCIYTNHKAFSEGYEQTLLPGNNGTTWTKHHDNSRL